MQAALRRSDPSPSPANQTLADHILVVDDVLAPADCQRLIDRFEASDKLEIRQRDYGYSFTQLDLSEAWPEEHGMLAKVFLRHFNDYRRAVGARFWPSSFALEHIRLKRYLPNGRDAFLPHVDVVDQLSARRFVTAMIYLNAPDGGETVFPELDICVKPEAGKLLAFPPLWLFPHAGLPPRERPKHILHTYLCYGA